MSFLASFQARIQALPFLKKPSLPRSEMLTLRPQRNPVIQWVPKPLPEGEEAEAARGGVVLTVPRREETPWGKWMTRLLSLPNTKTIELDEFGGQVWEQCDGTRSVEQLVQFTCARYKLNRRQGEVSVVQFMRMLAQRRLVGFAPTSVAGRTETTVRKETPHVSYQRRSGKRARRRN